MSQGEPVDVDCAGWWLPKSAEMAPRYSIDLPHLQVHGSTDSDPRWTPAYRESSPMPVKKTALLLATGFLALFSSGSASAAPITETFTFNLSGFVDIVNNLAPPDTTISGSFTVTYDPTLFYDNDTTDITVNYLNGVTVSSPLGFTYGMSGGTGFLEFGGTQNDSDAVGLDTNDLV